jgi:hypothetical protein
MKFFLRLGILTGAALLYGANTPPPTPPAPQPPPVAQKMLKLFDDLRAADDAKKAGKYRHVNFQLSDNEINDYMIYALKAIPRPGLDSVNVKLYPNNYISTFTVIDFDAVERWKPGTVPTLLKPILSGKKNVWVDYRFHADNGTATFSVEKAYYQSTRIPAFLVEKVIQIVAARQPEKYDTSKPLPIPFGLRQVTTTAEHIVAGQN